MPIATKRETFTYTCEDCNRQLMKTHSATIGILVHPGDTIPDTKTCMWCKQQVPRDPKPTDTRTVSAVNLALDEETELSPKIQVHDLPDGGKLEFAGPFVRKRKTKRKKAHGTKTPKKPT